LNQLKTDDFTLTAVISVTKALAKEDDIADEEI
jgi:hypothetical protein